MKRLAIFLTAALVSTAALAAKYEASETKTYNFQLGDNSALDIDNKYGSIIVSEWDKSELQMVVERKTTSGESQETADMLLSCVKVDVKQTGKKVKGVTTIKDCYNNNAKLLRKNRYSGYWGNSHETTYTVFVPKGTAYELVQSYGSIDMKGSITGTLAAEVRYGNLNAETLEKAANVNVHYGNVDIERASNLELELRYSKAKLPLVGSLRIYSSYSKINLGNVNTLQGESKYDDYKIACAADVNMEYAYTNVRMYRLTNAMNINTRYGDVSVDNVDYNFSNLRIISNYTDIKIDMSAAPNVTYLIDTEYCGVEISASWDKAVSKKVKDSKKRHYQGSLGNGTSKVEIYSRYGSVKIK